MSRSENRDGLVSIMRQNVRTVRWMFTSSTAFPIRLADYHHSNVC